MDSSACLYYMIPCTGGQSPLGTASLFMVWEFGAVLHMFAAVQRLSNLIIYVQSIIACSSIQITFR